MRVLESERLRMREWTQADATFAFDMYARWEVQRFIGTAPRVMEDLSEAAVAIARWRSLKHPVHGVWAVEHRYSGQLLGTLLLKPIPLSADQSPLPASGDTEIGWHFHPAAWGHGYAAEAGLCGLTHAFDCGLPKVVAVTSIANTPSQKVAERIGMIHQGQSNRYYNTTCELFIATNRLLQADRIARSRNGSSTR